MKMAPRWMDTPPSGNGLLNMWIGVNHQMINTIAMSKVMSVTMNIIMNANTGRKVASTGHTTLSMAPITTIMATATSTMGTQNITTSTMGTQNTTATVSTTISTMVNITRTMEDTMTIAMENTLMCTIHMATPSQNQNTL